MDLTRCHECVWNQYELCDFLENRHRRPDVEVCLFYLRRTSLYYTGHTTIITTPACPECGKTESTSVPLHIGKAVVNGVGRVSEVLAAFGDNFRERFTGGRCEECQASLSGDEKVLALPTLWHN